MYTRLAEFVKRPVVTGKEIRNYILFVIELYEDIDEPKRYKVSDKHIRGIRYKTKPCWADPLVELLNKSEATTAMLLARHGINIYTFHKRKYPPLRVILRILKLHYISYKDMINILESIVRLFLQCKGVEIYDQ